MKRNILITAFLAISVQLFAANTDIRLNSIGYRPNSVKKASIKVNTMSVFYVRTAPSGPTVLTGTAVSYGLNNDTGETLWAADFSSVTVPGTYFISVPSVGTSFNFTISEDVYFGPFYTVFRGFYLWRCGTAVSGAHNSITYSHTACHLNDGYLDYVGGGHVIQNGTGGWHDAGDYNKYVTNANVTFGVLGKAWEYLWYNFYNVALDLPETAAGYPEYLKELKWEADWLLKMQAEDGRVYHKLSSTDFAGDWVMPQYNTENRFYVPYSTAATADFTAMMAQAYRLFSPYDAAYANQCLSAARVSYARITTAPDNVNVAANQAGFSTGDYATTDSDDRMWAAAEMWESTGEDIFKNDFETRANATGVKVSYSMDWGDVRNLGMFTYYKSARGGKDTALLAAIGNQILSNANSYVNGMNAHGYNRIFNEDYWWGVNGAVARASLTLYMAYQMTQDQDYVRAGYAILDHIFGRNYNCRSMVTGLGYNPPLYPHDRRSSTDGIAAPWPGYLIGGPQPGATSWVDSESDYTTGEIAINWNAALVFNLAWLMKDPIVPTPTITGTPPTETVTPTITETHTISPTLTITETHTVSPTATITPTELYDTLEIKDHFTYPNPSKGAPVVLRFNNNGYIETMKIKIFTVSDRKVGEVEAGPFNSGLMNEVEWNPPDKLGNGMYIYVIEARGKNTPVVKKQGGFVILQHLQ